MSDTPLTIPLSLRLSNIGSANPRGQLAMLLDEVSRLERQRDALAEAAQAVVARWDTPLWKDVPATADYINKLRAALRAIKEKK